MATDDSAALLPARSLPVARCLASYASAHLPQNGAFADVDVPAEHADAVETRQDLRHDPISQHLPLRGASRCDRFNLAYVGFLDRFLKPLADEPDGSQRNREDTFEGSETAQMIASGLSALRAKIVPSARMPSRRVQICDGALAFDDRRPGLPDQTFSRVSTCSAKAAKKFPASFFAVP